MFAAITVTEQLGIDLPKKHKTIEHVGILGKSEPFPCALSTFNCWIFSVAKLASQRERLEAQRRRLLRLAIEGVVTTEDYQREAKRLEGEMRDLERLAPAPVPAAFDPAKMLVYLTRTFARFAKQPLEEKRNLLRTAFKEIVLDNGTIPAFTLNGAFLDSVNSLTRSSLR